MSGLDAPWSTWASTTQTLSGSRNGLTPLMLWYALARHGDDGIRQVVSGMLDTAEYAIRQFNEREIKAWRHTNSVTIVFPKPPDAVFRKVADSS